MIDGGLRQKFREHLTSFDWTSIESSLTGGGIPDANFCGCGVEGWIEYKLTDGWAVSFKPMQVPWIMKRVRYGGRVFVAVRRKHDGGPRRGDPVDELWLYHGRDARALEAYGLNSEQEGGPAPLVRAGGGPARWPWEAVRAALAGPG